MEEKKTYSLEYQKDEENKILIRSFYGKLGMNGVIASWEDDINNNIVTKDFNAIITDFTNSENTVQMSDLGEIAAFYDKNFELFKDIKLAVVIDTPSVAILLLYEDQNTKLNHKAFTTVEAAMNWCII